VLAVGERHMVETDRCSGRQICRRSRLDERRQPGNVVGLDMCLEDRADRCAQTAGLLEVLVDEAEVWIDDGELPMRETAEQVARAGCGGEEKRPQDHGLATR
jgi:hypothetical protein